jgi:hypothetical protein
MRPPSTHPVDDEIDLAYTEIAQTISAWAWRGAGNAPDILNGAGTVAAGAFEVVWQALAPFGSTRRAVTLELRHPDSSQHGLEWSTWFEVGRRDDRVTVTMRLSREATELSLVPAALELRRPKVVVTLLERFACRAGDVPLSAQSSEPAPDGADAFVDDVLTNSGRALPVLVLCPPAGGDFLAQPRDIADELAGVAHVAGLSGHLAWERLTTRLARELTVPRGGARLYWPGFGSDRHLRHRLWTASSLRQLGSEAIARELFGMLSRLSVRAVPRDPLVAELRHQLTDERLAQAREQGGDPELMEAYEATLGDVTLERDQLKADLEGLHADLVEAREEIRSLSSEVATHRANYAVAHISSVPAVEADELADFVPTSWDDVADMSELLDTDGFELTDRAREQLADNPTPIPPVCGRS